MPFMLIYAELSKPKPIKRDPTKQVEIARQCSQLTLYQFATCPFCIKVKKEIHRLCLPIQMANIRRAPKARQRLSEGGGKQQVPCLHIIHDDGRQEWMYESNDINRYLQQKFSD
ncbi:MAG: hypothetical protein CENE_01071 [Candidatus Celerinatantimonas neptuna]|nr:MAG: hypothetical protein CENE_01071 [Candidatus Celerinatantimonas neptuna]